MAEMSSHEKFLAGVPLNAELEALRDGKVQPFAYPAAVSEAAPAYGEDGERELTPRELSELKELRQGPGWPVLQRLLEKALQSHRRSAIAISQIDPLKNVAAISEAWAYVTTFRRCTIDLEALVDAEVQKLSK